MKSVFVFLLLIVFSYLGFSQTPNSPYGNWTLESWSVGIEMDLNKDGKSSDNLITETSCRNLEVLSIMNNNTLSDMSTFNPTVNISKSGNVYRISEKCNKGSIGFSNSFKIVDSNLNLDQGDQYKMQNGKLIRTFEGAINVFNDGYSDIIETKDLVLIYCRN